MKPESVIGKTTEQQDAEDALAVRLSQVAYATPLLGKRKNRSSRFWFQLNDNELVVTKEAMRPKKLEHIDSQVEHRLSRYKKSSPKQFQSHIHEVREFFLNEIAPRTVAASGGTLQAVEVLTRLLDTEVDPSTVDRFNMMLNRATTLKMAQFVVNYFGLPQEHLGMVIGLKHDAPPIDPAILVEAAAHQAATQTSKQFAKIAKRQDDEKK